jgi:hypothetical protein
MQYRFTQTILHSLIGNIFFERLVTEKQECLFMIFHEVGHIVLNHYQKYAAITKDRKKLPPGTVILLKEKLMPLPLSF